jgi:hypothetical protein
VNALDAVVQALRGALARSVTHMGKPVVPPPARVDNRRELASEIGSAQS